MGVQETNEANARRIVACVNACEGISTENLEQNRPLIWLVQQYNETIRQRNELLLALQETRLCLEVANDTQAGPIIDTVWRSGCETLFDFIDAALEKSALATTEMSTSWVESATELPPRNVGVIVAFEHMGKLVSDVGYHDGTHFHADLRGLVMRRVNVPVPYWQHMPPPPNEKERKFLCDDCLTTQASNEEEK